MRDSKLKSRMLKILDSLSFFKKRMLIKVKYSLPIMDSKETIEYIKEHNCSIARYGDGDFGLMMQEGNEGYQKITPELAQALKQVFSNDSPNLLVCIPRYLNSTRGCTQKAKNYWITWKISHQIEVVNVIRHLAGSEYRFGDSLLSRPYMDYTSPRQAKILFPLLKELWEAKDIMIVEGEKTCLGVSNDLFNNARSIKRIIAPATDAFDHYVEIMDGILSKWKGELIILALGPTATVLASDLSKRGIQALDIGHVDIEYEWYRMGAKQKVAIPGKYVNEAKNGNIVSSCENQTYLSQIILRIGLPNGD